jgi:hypothetical protein
MVFMRMVRPLHRLENPFGFHGMGILASAPLCETAN